MAAKTQPLTTETVWLVTGCSSGLGRALAFHIASSGHSLIATARNISSLAYLPTSDKVLPFTLDVTSPSAINSVFAAALEKFGKVDVVVNNAGYALMGDTENASDEESRLEFETNFWGVVNMSKEAVRVMRDNNSKGSGGLIVQVSSIGGVVGFPAAGFYHASKFAMEGFTEAFAREMHPDWNIKFLILEPGAVRTNFGTSSLKLISPHPAYTDPSCPSRLMEGMMTPESLKKLESIPDRVAEVVFDVIVRRENNLPLRLPLGGDANGIISMKLDLQRKEVEEWKQVSRSTMDEDTLKASSTLADFFLAAHK